MKKLRRFWKLVGTEVLILGVASAVFGMAIAIFVYGNQNVNSIAEPTSFQNFAVMVGALTGLVICLIGALLYLLSVKLLHHKGFHFRFYLISSGITGLAIGLVTWGIINLSAGSYGITEHTGELGLAIEGASFGIFGGIIGVIIGVVLNLIKGYNS